MDKHTVCLSHSKLSNQISSLPVDPAGNSITPPYWCEAWCLMHFIALWIQSGAGKKLLFCPSLSFIEKMLSSSDKTTVVAESTLQQRLHKSLQLFPVSVTTKPYSERPPLSPQRMQIIRVIIRPDENDWSFGTWSFLRWIWNLICTVVRTCAHTVFFFSNMSDVFCLTYSRAYSLQHAQYLTTWAYHRQTCLQTFLCLHIQYMRNSISGH